MSFEFRHLKALGDSISIPIPKDEDGFLGRECPDEACEGYFKIKPGTGLVGENLPVHCPYCGRTDTSSSFFTKEQIEFAKSVALRQVTKAFRADLKTLEFESKPRRGSFGIGISLKLQPGVPIPLRHYREQTLETHIVCEHCTLEYSIFGVFAFCPDCRSHNSLQILRGNLSLIDRQLVLADSLEDEALSRHLREDALENCVSAFDGFGRATVSVRARHSSNPAKAENISFQNLVRAEEALRKYFDISLMDSVEAVAWRTAHVGFMRRHVIAHQAGVVDQRYIDETSDYAMVVGRKIQIGSLDVRRVADSVATLGAALIGALPTA
jgi:hypothetical protein